MKSIMWKYMQEEKDLLQALLKNTEDQQTINGLKNIEALYIVAHGSSYNSATCLAPMISKLAKIRVYVYNPSNFMNCCQSLQFENPETCYVCGISQTGTSRGVIEAVNKGKAQGFKVLTITNVKDSHMDNLADATLYLHCGEEDSNAKTKGYSSTLVVLMKLALNLANTKGLIEKEFYDETMCGLLAEVEALPLLQMKIKTWCEQHKYGEGMTHLYVIGNGINFGTAMEGMLKLMETQCIPTLFSDIEEFCHGMHRSVNEHSHVILLQSSINNDLMDKSFDYFNNKNVNVLMLNGYDQSEADYKVSVGTYPFDSVLSLTAAIQVISCFVPELNGTDPNRNANDDYTDCMTTRI